MAKRQATGRTRSARSSRSAKKTTRSVKRPRANPPRQANAKKAARTAGPRRTAKSPAGRTAARPAKTAVVIRHARAAGRGTKTPRLERTRRTLDEHGVPSSLDLVRQGSAVRSGRAEIEHSLTEHRGMGASIKGGDVDVNVEDAYFTGDEAPGGDNPTPDQEVVDDIGKALGVQYQDNEELRPNDKVEERDKHRWELDPASAEDYRDRK